MTASLPGPLPGPRRTAPPHRRNPYDGFPGIVGRTFAESDPAWPAPPRPRQLAPNIVVVVVNDLGYADIGPFGSEIPTPALDRIARDGLVLTNYHTAPLSSPARAALLTGLNPHRVGYATVANVDPGFPGYDMRIADDVPTLAEILHDAGYATYAVGKWHLARDAASNAADDRRDWPLHQGFDQYYGVLESLTSLFQPHQLVRDNTPLDIDAFDEDYYYTDDITDQAIGMVTGLRAHDPDKPFLLYLAHHAVHGPLQARPADIARHRGRYDDGWDALRAARFDRQRAAGLFPPDTRLPEREPGADRAVPAWADLTPAERRRYARCMEVYAAMVDSVDRNLGRLTATLDALGELDNTIIVVTSDTGGGADDGPGSTLGYLSGFVRHPGLPEAWAADAPPGDPELIGGPRSLTPYPRGWALASHTPFRLPADRTHTGGERVPLLVCWPAGLHRAPDDDGLRHQYQHVTDLTPTLLDLAGVRRPTERRGRPVQEADGVSFVPVLAAASAPSTHPEQYGEAGGNRSYHRDGWKLVTRHRPGEPYDDEEWSLFDLGHDPTETTDVAADHPVLVKELAAAWETAAWRDGVFPLVDASGALAFRSPEEQRLLRPVTLLPGTPELERYRSSRLIAFRSFTLTVSVRGHAAGDQGVLVSHGDQGGGYALYVEDGRLRLAFNEYGELHEADAGPFGPGPHVVEVAATALPDIRWSFDVWLDGVRTGGLDGVRQLVGMAPLQGISVGLDRKSPVSWPVHQRHGTFRYTGDLAAVTYTPGESAPYDPQEIAQSLRDAAAAAD